MYVGSKTAYSPCLTYKQSARELTAATLGQELAAALKQVHGWIEHPEADEDLSIKDPAHLDAFGQRLKLALRGLWKDIPSDVFDVGFVKSLSIYLAPYF